MKCSERLKMIYRNKFKIPNDAVEENLMLFYDGKLLTPSNEITGEGYYKIEDGELILLFKTYATFLLLILIDFKVGSRWILNNDDFSWVKL